MSEYGEPLTSTTLLSGVLNLSSSEFLERAVSCVNACAGFDPPEMRRLAVAMKIWETYGYHGGLSGDIVMLAISGDKVLCNSHDPESILSAARELKLPEIEMLEAK